MLICLPGDWRWRELAILAAGALAPSALLRVGDTERPFLILAILAVPVLAALGLRLFSGGGVPRERRRARGGAPENRTSSPGSRAAF